MPRLLGHAVGVTGDRRSEELTAHLLALGASVVHGPVLHTSPIASDQRDLRAATDALVERPPQYLLVTTGIGARGWFNAAAAWGLEAPLLAALARTRVLARGPKAIGAVAEAGLDVWYTAPNGQTLELVEHLLRQPIDGAHVAIQLPGAAMPDVIHRLRARGASVTPLTIYDWTWPDDLTAARRLLRAITEGRVSAVTFTSRPAVRNLVALAATDGVEDALRKSLAGSVVAACIGAVTAGALHDLTGAIAVVPRKARLGMLAPVVADAVGSAGHHHVRTGPDEVVVQGRLVRRGDDRVTTSDREAAVLAHLVRNVARTVGRAYLLRSIWHDDAVDASVLETTVARLRRRVHRIGLRIHTVTGRGYLLDGEAAACPAAAELVGDPGLSTTIHC